MPLVCTDVGMRRVVTAHPALMGVTMSLGPGELVGVVGCSGAGKTTLLRLLAGRDLPTEGSVFLDGRVLSSDDATRRDFASHVGLVGQNPERQLFARTAWEDVAFGPRNAGLADDVVARRVSSALDAVGMDEEKARRTSPYLLSGGDQRRVALAGVLALQSAYLLLDEPTAGLDSRGRAQVMALTRQLALEGTCVVVASHDLECLAAQVDRLIVLCEGRLLFDGSATQGFGDERLMDNVGLEQPFAARFATRLRRRGIPVPTEGSKGESSLVDALCALTERGRS